MFLIVISVVVVLIAAGVYYVSTIIPIGLIFSGGPGGYRGSNKRVVYESFELDDNFGKIRKWKPKTFISISI